MSTSPLDRASSLTDDIRAAADDIEANACIPDQLVEALFSAGLFDLLLPAECGGAEAPLPDFLEVVEQLAFGDASVAWSVAQASVFSTNAARLSPSAATEIYGDSKTSMVHGPPKQTTAVRVDGGYRVTGLWGFGTGIAHSTWLAGRCAIAGEKGTYLLVMFPTSAAMVVDNWDVSGLIGTGSQDFSVEDLFVPTAHTLLADAQPFSDNSLYLFPLIPLFSTSFASVALATSMKMLEYIVDLAKAKTADHTRHTLAVDPHVHQQVGLARAGCSAARHYLHGEVATVWAEVVATNQLTMDQRIRLRLCSTHTLREARRVADICWDIAGTSELTRGGEFHRRYQDMIVMGQHLQARTAHYPLVGRYTLGDRANIGPLV